MALEIVIMYIHTLLFTFVFFNLFLHMENVIFC